MVNDIVDKLRTVFSDTDSSAEAHIGLGAADYIEALEMELFEQKVEVERLRGDLHFATGTCELEMKHRDTAENEIGRLRVALQSIVDQGETVCLWDAQEIARRALS